jgi:hypothetical protein
MIIQVNTDSNITGGDHYTAYVTALLESALSRFGEHITRVEVHLADENGSKSGQDDKRCVLEARIEGLQPTAVTQHAASLELAVSGAIKKLKASLTSTLGRLSDHG